MRVRRSLLVTAAVIVVAGLVAGGTYAFAGDDTPPGGQATSGNPSTSTDPSPSTVEPSVTPSTTPSAEPEKEYKGCPKGKKQLKVEELLNTLGGFGTLVVDGKQSKSDCAAIKKFQKRYDIRPAEGSAGPLTEKIARRLAETDIDKCDGDKGLVACIDLTHQTTFIMKDGEVIVPPTITRTGMAGGYQTPAGKYKIDWRSEKAWSKPFSVWLPYWQHFINGMGFHETTTYIHDSFGSHGCVNLLHKDAVKFYETLKLHTVVHSFGNRPGT